MITKPAVTRVPIIVSSAGGDQVVSSSPKEIVSIHFSNTTAGAGSVVVHDGDSSEGVALSAAAASGTDDWCPAQPARFDKIHVDWGGSTTGLLTIQVN